MLFSFILIVIRLVSIYHFPNEKAVASKPILDGDYL